MAAERSKDSVGAKSIWGRILERRRCRAYLWSRGIQTIGCGGADACTSGSYRRADRGAAEFSWFPGCCWDARRRRRRSRRLKKLATDLHVPMEHELRGAEFLWDGVQVDILWPEIAQDEVAPLAKNNDSLVMRLQYGERTMLLPGDAEKQVEYAMLGENDATF